MHLQLPRFLVIITNTLVSCRRMLQTVGAMCIVITDHLILHFIALCLMTPRVIIWGFSGSLRDCQLKTKLVTPSTHLCVSTFLLLSLHNSSVLVLFELKFLWLLRRLVTRVHSFTLFFRAVHAWSCTSFWTRPTSYKPVVIISPNLQLSCSWGQNLTRLDIEVKRSQWDQIWSKKH